MEKITFLIDGFNLYHSVLAIQRASGVCTKWLDIESLCKSLFPQKKIVFAFPYARKNKELLKLAPGSFSINRKQYIRHQFPNPVILKDNSKIYKPSSW